MGKTPRNANQLKPYLLDIHCIWQRMRTTISAPGRLWTLFQIATLSFIVVGAVIVSIVQQFTDIRRDVSTNAAWRISRIDDTQIIHLRFTEFPDFAEESVISDALLTRLTATRPSRLTVKMVVIYDFGTPRTKGPTLVADGIRLDE